MKPPYISATSLALLRRNRYPALMPDKQPFYLTTPIYYVSDKPHIGHAYTTIVGDAICRYQRLQGVPEDVFFLTGTDEHGEKIERAAKAQGLSPQAFVDAIAQSYKDLWQILHIQYDDFIRTTEERHKLVVEDLWKKLEAQGDIYQGAYEGLYCVACESFYPEKELLPGNLCPDHKRPVELVKEEGYFFRLSKYEKALLSYYDAHPDFIQPDIRKNEVRSFVEGGLRDLSVSRSSFSWGINVPGAKGHVIYVWIDALTNYYSALQHPPERRRFWGTQTHPVVIHLIGKEISRFHAVYWPAMLMAAGLPLPQKIFAHGWWTVDGEKMSKTLGNVVDPKLLADDLGADALRYFLLREVPLGQDGDFSYDTLLARYNNELANDLGNLLHRTLSMIEKFSEGQAMAGKVGTASAGAASAGTTFGLPSLESGALKAKRLAEEYFEQLQPSLALVSIFAFVREANAYLEQQAPFRLAKTNLEAARYVLYQALEALRWLSMMLAPFMPERMIELRRQLGLPNPEQVTWPNVFGEIPEGMKIQKGAPLFPRLDPDKQDELLTKWRASRRSKNAGTQNDQEQNIATPAPTKDLLSFEEFQRLDLRVAHVMAAERVPKKDKLLKLTVDVGAEQRTIVAGIGQAYAPEQLIGRSVALLTNLRPAKIGGIVSEGMILAIGDEQILGLLTPDQSVPAGSKIR